MKKRQGALDWDDDNEAHMPMDICDQGMGERHQVVLLQQKDYDLMCEGSNGGCDDQGRGRERGFRERGKN
jgi:hypothetical protein